MKKNLILSLFVFAGILGAQSQSYNGIANQGAAAITNSALANSAIIINGVCGISSPGSTALGGTATLTYSNLPNAQTGTSYTILSTDCSKLVTFSNASAVAVTLPQATGSFAAGYNFQVINLGVGTVTITPTTSTINGAATLVLTTGQGTEIFSDGTNYQIQAGKANLPTVITETVNTVTYSTTPTFNAALGSIQLLTLTGNVTSSTLSNLQAGQTLTMIICQNGTGGFTFVWPTAFKGTLTIGSTASTCSAEMFKATTSSVLYSVTPGVINQ